MKRKIAVIFILGLALTIVGCNLEGKLNVKVSDEVFYVDKDGLKPIIANGQRELIEFDKIKELQIDTNITDIELISEESDTYQMIIENIESDYISLMEIDEDNGVVNISNELLKDKPLGILDDASSKSKLIIQGPIAEIAKISIKNSVGSINFNNAELNNIYVKATATDVTLTNSKVEDFSLDLELSDLTIRSTSIIRSEIDLNKSRIFGENNEFKGENQLSLTIVEGEVGIKNYDELFNKNTSNKLKLEGNLNRFEFIDER